MNSDNSRMDFFYPFGIKIMIGEKSPEEDKARGLLDRSFKIKSYKGYPAYDIKEIMNPQGNVERQHLFDELMDLRKLLLMLILVHFKNPYTEIDIGLDGRDRELWSKVMLEPLECRAHQIYEILEESCRVNRQIASNKNSKPMDRIKASKGMVNAQYNLLQLLRMGPNNFEYCEII
jgi:hypothetical protein